jgi:hypothetical protein
MKSLARSRSALESWCDSCHAVAVAVTVTVAVTVAVAVAVTVTVAVAVAATVVTIAVAEGVASPHHRTACPVLCCRKPRLVTARSSCASPKGSASS